jgi:hypothetical protein
MKVPLKDKRLDVGYKPSEPAHAVTKAPVLKMYFIAPV